MGAPDFFEGIKRSQVRNPANCIMLGDVPGWTVLNDGKDPYVTTSGLQHHTQFITQLNLPRAILNTLFWRTRRHSGLSSMAFVDGHVESHIMHDWTLLVVDNIARLNPKGPHEDDKEYTASMSHAVDESGGVS